MSFLKTFGGVIAISALAITVFISAPATAQVVTCDPTIKNNQTITKYLTDLPSSAFTIKTGHIFCGNVNSSGKSSGFHARTGGVTPPTVDSYVLPSMEDYDPEIDEIVKINTVYEITNVVITDNNIQGSTKTSSTMFPDWCTQNEVVNAIVYAMQNLSSGQGPSGKFCLNEDGSEFDIKILTNSGNVETAYPLMPTE